MTPELQRQIKAALHGLNTIQDASRPKPDKPLPLTVPVSVGTFNLLLFVLEELAQD